MYEFAFSLHPEAFQPSGTMNFSKTDSATLVLSKKNTTDLPGMVSAVARAYIRKLNTVTVVRGVGKFFFTLYLIYFYLKTFIHQLTFLLLIYLSLFIKKKLVSGLQVKLFMPWDYYIFELTIIEKSIFYIKKIF